MDSPSSTSDATGTTMTMAQASTETTAKNSTQPVNAATLQPAALTQNMLGIILAALIGVAAGALAISYPIWTPHVYSNGAVDAAAVKMTAVQVNRRLNGEVGKLQGKIDELTRGNVEMQKAIIMARLPGILMAAGELNDVLQGAAPFEKQLKLFDAVTGGTSAEAKAIIDALKPYAAAGAPTEDQLVAAVDDLVFQIISTDQKITSIPQLPDQMFNTMAGISAITMRLRWRLEGLPIGDSVPATMARAEARVKERDFNGAVSELETLPELHKEAAETWINSFKARQAVDAVRQDLQSYLLAIAVRVPQ
jgi:hypothetical protein